MEVFEYLKKHPQTSVQLLSQKLKMTAPTARSALNSMKDLSILEEVSGQKRNKVYVYRQYLTILEEGTEPFKL